MGLELDKLIFTRKEPPHSFYPVAATTAVFQVRPVRVMAGGGAVGPESALLVLVMA